MKIVGYSIITGLYPESTMSNISAWLTRQNHSLLTASRTTHSILKSAKYPQELKSQNMAQLFFLKHKQRRVWGNYHFSFIYIRASDIIVSIATLVRFGNNYSAYNFLCSTSRVGQFVHKKKSLQCDGPLQEQDMNFRSHLCSRSISISGYDNLFLRCLSAWTILSQSCYDEMSEPK